MKKYCVSLVFTKHGDKFNIQLYQAVNIEANNENEAFGLVYDKAAKKLPEHQLFLKVIGLQD